jgi:hypothetical protein
LPARRRDRPRDDREDDETQDVVDHRGPQDRLALAALDRSEVAQHSGGDADARGRERGADEQVDEQGALRQQPCRDAPPERHRGHDAEHGDQERGRAHPDESPQVGLQPDLEEQQQHADLGQEVQRGNGPEEVGAVTADDQRHEVAETHAHQQLAEHRWLPPALDDETADLRRGYEQGDRKERRPDPAIFSTGGPRRRDDEGDAEPYRPPPHVHSARHRPWSSC